MFPDLFPFVLIEIQLYMYWGLREYGLRLRVYMFNSHLVPPILSVQEIENRGI
jgi:hypothetical protein